MCRRADPVWAMLMVECAVCEHRWRAVFCSCATSLQCPLCKLVMRLPKIALNMRTQHPDA